MIYFDAHEQSSAQIFAADDIQMIMAGKRWSEITPEEYVLAVILLYLDTMLIFFYLSQILSDCDCDEWAKSTEVVVGKTSSESGNCEEASIGSRVYLDSWISYSWTQWPLWKKWIKLKYLFARFRTKFSNQIFTQLRKHSKYFEIR